MSCTLSPRSHPPLADAAANTYPDRSSIADRSSALAKKRFTLQRLSNRRSLPAGNPLAVMCVASLAPSHLKPSSCALFPHLPTTLWLPCVIIHSTMYFQTTGNVLHVVSESCSIIRSYRTFVLLYIQPGPWIIVFSPPATLLSILMWPCSTFPNSW